MMKISFITLIAHFQGENLAPREPIMSEMAW